MVQDFCLPRNVAPTIHAIDRNYFEQFPGVRQRVRPPLPEELPATCVRIVQVRPGVLWHDPVMRNETAMQTNEPQQRPQRHPRDKEIGAIVDLLTVKSEEMAEYGDRENAARLDRARRIVVDVALGIPPGERH